MVGLLMHGVVLASVILVFSASPDARVPVGLAWYRCFTWERHNQQVTCPQGEKPPCYEMTAITNWPSNPVLYPQPPLQYACDSPPPSPGQVVMVCAEALDVNGNPSDCVAGP